MEDADIVTMLCSRDERGLAEIRTKYGRGLLAVAARHLHDVADQEETVNDVLLEAWNKIPPEKPKNLFQWLSVLTRRFAVNRWEATQTQKRGGKTEHTPLDELAGLLPAHIDVSAEVEQRQLSAALNRFLRTLKPEARAFMIARYVHQNGIREIAEAYAVTESKVKITLMRTRKKLRSFLTEEGWI